MKFKILKLAAMGPQQDFCIVPEEEKMAKMVASVSYSEILMLNNANDIKHIIKEKIASFYKIEQDLIELEELYE